MDRIIRVSCAAIIITNICFEVTLANQRFESSADSTVKEEEESKIPSVWFSPRLGRRKRMLDQGYTYNEKNQELLDAYDQSPCSITEQYDNVRFDCRCIDPLLLSHGNPFHVSSKPTEQVQELLNSLKERRVGPTIKYSTNNNWICKTFVGKKRSPDYTPRPGRNVEEEDIPTNENWLDADNSAEYVIQRSPPFAPRLGRRFTPYSPRLGRDV